MRENIHKRELVHDWDELTDFEKIWEVVAAADQSPKEGRPSYDYLVRFLGDVGNAYKAETRLRKALANNCLLLFISLIVMGLVAVVGWLT